MTYLHSRVGILRRLARSREAQHNRRQVIGSGEITELIDGLDLSVRKYVLRFNSEITNEWIRVNLKTVAKQALIRILCTSSLRKGTKQIGLKSVNLSLPRETLA